MSLDTVDFVMDIEERFGIRIIDEEAAQMYTVAELYAFLLRQLRRRKPGTCPSASVFYRLRRALVNTCGVDRERVRLGSSVSEILGDTTPWRAWRNMRKELDFKLPPLSSPSWLSLVFAMMFATAVIGGAMTMGPNGALIVTAIAAIPVVLLHIYTRSLMRIAPECQTVRELVSAVAVTRPSEADHQPTVAWNALCDIIHDHTWMPKEKIRPETRFVEDLGF